jgi:hypothetical protein
MGRSLAHVMQHAPGIEPALEAAQWVVPMPLSAARLRERGFNQALVLARHLGPRKTLGQALLRQWHRRGAQLIALSSGDRPLVLADANGEPIISDLERTFDTRWRQLGGPPLHAEYHFAPDRNFRFDRCHPYARVYVEIDGGTESRRWCAGEQGGGCRQPEHSRDRVSVSRVPAERREAAYPELDAASCVGVPCRRGQI